MRTTVSLVILCLFICSCQQESPNNPIADKSNDTATASPKNKMMHLDASETGIHFTNTINESLNRNTLVFDYFFNGGGVAIGDVNNDGLSDVFFSGNDAANALYFNQGDMEFKSVTAKSLPIDNRWSTGCNMVDINNDGFLDIYVGHAGPTKNDDEKIDQFLINDGTGKFTDKIADFGLDIPLNTMHTAFFDYDNDGDLDLWINTASNFRGNIKGVYREYKRLSPSELSQRTLKLFKNEDGEFEDVSEEAGIELMNYGLGLATADFNDDGYIDVYVANDYFLPDYYFINMGDGTFIESIKSNIDHTSFYSMGCDAADINNDGILDIGVVDMTPSDHVRNKVLMESMDSKQFKFLFEELQYTPEYMFNSMQLGLGYGKFAEVGKQLGVSQTEWSWAALLADFDLDGYKDYFVANGYRRDTKNNDFKKQWKKESGEIEEFTEEVFNRKISEIPSTPIMNNFFINQKGEYFSDETSSRSNYPVSFSNGAAYGDLDNDGDLDLIVNNLDSKAHVLENKIDNARYIGISLESKTNPHSVFNAEVFVHTADMVQRMDYQFSRGYLSSMEPRLLFGLGNNKTVDKIVIKWLDGTQSTISNPKVNRYNNYIKEDLPSTMRDEVKRDVAFGNISKQFSNFEYSHKENNFDDFEEEILLPHKYSNLGPALSIGDINGDNKDDIFLGGALGQESLILSQNGTTFDVQRLSNEAKYEDIGSVFFDADKDGDLDLYVATGGGGDIASLDLLTDRLYINDGRGNMSLSPNAIPTNMRTSSNTVLPIDMDNDGDLDLFVAGRNKPGKYPQKENSYFLENNKGTFKIVMNDELQASIPGMITDAVILDHNKDGLQDIMITAEWSEPKIMINKSKGNFEVMPIDAMKGKSGWWQSITKVDLDQDGDLDYIVGNLGKNNKFQPSQKKPLGVLANDFDQSGSLDIVLTKQYKGKTVPVRGKECSTEQMPFLEAKFPSYSEFANSDIIAILGEDNISSSLSMDVTTFASMILWNDNGRFSSQELPFMAQTFPLLDASSLDVNNDGIPDVVLAGSIYETEPETPSYDASKGIIMYGSKNRNLKTEYKLNKTGLFFKSNTKRLGQIRLPAGQVGIVQASNNDKLQVYLKAK